MIKQFKSLFSPEQVTRILDGSKANRSIKAESKYGNMLRESRKIRLFYGNLSKKYLQKVFERNSHFSCQSYHPFFTILESRLDVVLYRSGFFESIATAKQCVLTGAIEINKKKVLSPATRVTPGDIIHISKMSTKTNNLIFTKQPLQAKSSLSINSKAIAPSISATRQRFLRKQIEWRFKASSYLLSLLQHKKRDSFLNNNLSVSSPKEMFKMFALSLLDNAKIKDKASNFAFLSFVSSNVAPSKSIQKHKIDLNGQDEMHYVERNPISEGIKKWMTINFDKCKKIVVSKWYPNKFFLQENSTLSLQGKDITNWLFLNYKLFLKNQFIKLSKSRSPQQRKNSFESKQPFLLTRSESPKVALFLKQKTSCFFKKQLFFDAKKSKPLHLEISYKSKYIIFLFPPQRICFPTFINVSQIFK